jgi:hypothetical protein
LIATDPDNCLASFYKSQIICAFNSTCKPVIPQISGKMPAVLGRMLMPPLRRLELSSVRFVSLFGSVEAKPARKQLTVNEVGHFKYERDRSRDATLMNPQKRGDTPLRYVYFGLFSILRF